MTEKAIIRAFSPNREYIESQLALIHAKKAELRDFIDKAAYAKEVDEKLYKALKKRKLKMMREIRQMIVELNHYRKGLSMPSDKLSIHTPLRVYQAMHWYKQTYYEKSIAN